MKIKYNAPVILTYTIFAILILVISTATGGGLMGYFVSPAHGSLPHPIAVFQLFSHALGHADFAHLLGNLTLMLLIGPLLEEKYGSGKMLEMFVVTALVVALLNYYFFPTRVIGGSGVVFMLILLGSISNIRSGEIPLTFIFVAVLFLGNEVVDSMKSDQISQFSHLAGGLIGATYGFVRLR